MLPIDTSTYSFDPLYISVATGAVVNVAKHSDHPMLKWISETTPWVARSLHTFLAAISAAGMTLSYTTADDGTLAVTLAGISFASIGGFAFTAMKNFLGQAGTSVVLDGVRRQFEIHSMLKRLLTISLDQNQQLEKTKE